MRTINPRRKRSAQSDSEARRPGLRLIALTCAGLTLIGGAYQTAFARSSGPTASSHGYPHPSGGEDEGGGFIGNLSTAESIAVILVPAAILGAGIYLESQENDDNDGDRRNSGPSTFLLGGNVETDDRAPALPEGERVSKVRLVPGTRSLQAGHGFRVQMEGKSARDGRWYSLTNHPAARVDVQGERSALLPVDGVPAAFGLSVTAPASANGQEVALKGTFAPQGTSPLSAETKVRLVVPDGNALAAR